MIIIFYDINNIKAQNYYYNTRANSDDEVAIM